MRKPIKKVLAALGGVAVLMTILGPAPATAERKSSPLEGEGEGLELIANIPYSGGTDMEFATIKGREYAFAGDAPSIGNDAGAVRVIDITNPAKPKVAATIPCSLYQADIQLSHDKKTLIVAADDNGGPDSCGLLGKMGFLTIDIKNPKKPKVLGFAVIGRGSHNVTAHPTKPYVYNSDSDLENTGEIEIWSIKNPRKPTLVSTVASLPHSPHDISFNKKGTLAVTAAVSHFDIYDTSDPESPTLLFTGQCPGCSITHDAKFSPDGKRIVVGDEGGGGLSYPCPGGALYFYDLMGTAEQPVPVLTGVYEPDEFVAVNAPGLGACTSHVFDFSDDGTKISISWYTAGTRYLDITSTTGPTVGGNGTGVKELGWFIPVDGDSWSSKFHKGPYIYSNDINRGFDVYKIAK